MKKYKLIPGRCDILIAPGPTRRPFNKSYWADPVRLGNHTYRPGYYWFRIFLKLTLMVRYPNRTIGRKFKSSYTMYPTR